MKNTLAIKTIVRIITRLFGYGILIYLLVDGVFNDKIASMVSEFDWKLYVFCVTNKRLVLLAGYVILCAVIAFFEIRASNQNMLEIILAMDQILKEPEKEITLSKDLLLLGNKLNNIRVDLLTSQQAAKEAEQKKKDLIMYMAHDLKTPLTSVIGYLTLLSEETEISKNLQKKYLEIALNKAIRLEELTNQFFEITRYNLKDMPIHKQKIDLSFLLEQLIEECYPMLQERNLQVSSNMPDHVYFLGDGDKLARAFGNLLKNAISYSYENTNIEIQVSQNDDKIKCVFRNKADKIPDYKLDKLFDKFYRADEARTSQTGGTGLGLAITKEIIELHEGTIRVKNDTEYIEFLIELKMANE